MPTHETPAATRTTTIMSGCPKCGTIAKSGESSCCGRGGSWFKNCGGVGNAKLHHTWYEGIQACKARSQSMTVVDEQLNGAQPKDIDSSQATVVNGKTVTAATKTFVFASVNTSSRSMFDTKSIVTTTYTSDKVLTTTPAHLSMTNTPRVYLNKASSSNKSAIPSSSIRECMGLLTSILHVNFLIMFVS